MFVAGNEVLSQRHWERFEMARRHHQHASRGSPQTTERLDRAHSTSLTAGLVAATTLRLRVDLGATFHKLFRFFLHP